MPVYVKKSVNYTNQQVRVKELGLGGGIKIFEFIASAYVPPPPPPPPPSPSPGGPVWTYVIDPDAVSGPGAASITNPSPDVYTIVGPNNSSNDGWAYIKAQFASSTNVTVQYSWSTTDGLAYDWPFYAVTATEPMGSLGTGPLGTTFGAEPGNIVTTSPQAGTLSPIAVPAGQWLSLGIYSVESCCGAGNVTFTLSYS